MPEAKLITWIREKYMAIAYDLDERGRRRWAAAEARSLGWGGISAVSNATGISDRTIRNGIKELDDPSSLGFDRQRLPGAGRKRLEKVTPDIVEALNELLEPISRGDPMSPLRWTCKSTHQLAKDLSEQGYSISSTKVAHLLREQGYSLQANKKTVEGKQHPDRNAQFEFISKRVKARQRQDEPAISVDTKKKENLGNMKNSGKLYCPKGQPVRVKTHDFPDKSLGKAVPYGVYDINLNLAGVSVGISHDTAEFAVAAIRRWWAKLGKKKYKVAKRLLITADSGGSNSSRANLWKWELQKFANSSGLIIEVCHYPPGTSKWNKIEHRLFCHITRNWQGVPLESIDVVVSLIGATRTSTGLEVHAWLDEKIYEKGKKLKEHQLEEICIKRNKFHGEWNYEIRPSKT